MKIVINNCYGGFGLSKEAIDLLNERGRNKYSYLSKDMERDDPILIKIIEELGVKANNNFSELRIIEIPDGVEYEIVEYDGMEYIAEAHRKWY